MSGPVALPEDQEGLVTALVALAEDGMMSGVDEEFDIDAFIAETRSGG